MKSEKFLASYPRKKATLCSVSGCRRNVASHGMCNIHWKRFERRGTTEKFERTRKDYVDSTGYIKRYVDGYRQGQYVHRLLMEQEIGRKLFPGESVHHKNGVKTDNRIENLELWVSWQPHGARVEDLIAFAKQILERYANGSASN